MQMTPPTHNPPARLIKFKIYVYPHTMNFNQRHARFSLGSFVGPSFVYSRGWDGTGASWILHKVQALVFDARHINGWDLFFFYRIVLTILGSFTLEGGRSRLGIKVNRKIWIFYEVVKISSFSAYIVKSSQNWIFFVFGIKIIIDF